MKKFSLRFSCILLALLCAVPAMAAPRQHTPPPPPPPPGHIAPPMHPGPPPVREEHLSYNMDLRMVFGCGSGERTVSQTEFNRFTRDVLSPAFENGYSLLDATGQWTHPQRGLIREKNYVLMVSYIDSPQSRATQSRVAREFVNRFRKFGVSVFVLRVPHVDATSFF